MTTIRLLVRCADGNWSGIIPSRIASRAVAALSAGPSSFDDLRAAMRRFVGSPVDVEPLAELVPGDCDTPHERGLVVVDLPARLVAADPDFMELSHRGELFWLTWDEPQGWEATEVALPYELSTDWLLSDQLDAWRDLANKRREMCDLNQCDFREILYGRPLYEYIATRVWDAYRAALRSGELDADRSVFSETGVLAEPEDEEPPLERFDFRGSNAEWRIIKRLHVGWLLAPRSDLRESSPREIALARQNRVAVDLEDQARRWTLLGAEPPGIPFDSAAYRYSSFGVHEWVQYYDLVRELLWDSWFRLTATCSESTSYDRTGGLPSAAGDRAAFRQSEIARLAARAEEWLDTPCFHPNGRTPRSIIERERSRLPEVEQDPQTVYEPDCPFCEMLRLTPGPIFWQLDGCHFDDDFAFDLFCESEEEWREKQIDWQCFVQRVKQED